MAVLITSRLLQRRYGSVDNKQVIAEMLWQC